MRSEELIGALANRLSPVRRMASPRRQAVAWLGLAVGAIGVAVAVEGFRPDLELRLTLSHEVGQLVASAVAGVTAALAAAMLARADRSSLWALLPVPGVLAWFATLGWGCLADMDRMGPDAMVLGTSWGCMRFILGLGIPLSAALFWLLRHAGPIRPGPVLALGSLAAAALSSLGLSLFHHLDASLMILIWHGGAAVLLMLLGGFLGRPLLARPGP